MVESVLADVRFALRQLIKSLYLTQLQRHAVHMAVRPANWMPWNYRDTLMHLTPAAAA